MPKDNSERAEGMVERLQWTAEHMNGAPAAQAREAAARITTLEAENSKLREALEPFAELAAGEVFEKFAAECEMTFVLCRPSDHKRFAFLNAECLVAARAALEPSHEGENTDG